MQQIKNLRSVFQIIRKHCAETGTSSEACFAELEQQPLSHSMLFPLYYYIRILQSLGLVKLIKHEKGFTLTETGKIAERGMVSRSQVLMILSLHAMRRIVITSVLFVLFWPVFLAIATRHRYPDSFS